MPFFSQYRKKICILNPFAVSLKSSGTLLESYLIRQSVPFLPLVLSIELHLPEYSEQEFQNIVIKLAYEKHNLDEGTAKEVARVVWHEIKTKDVRDAIQLSKLVDSVDDVMMVARTIMKYKSEK
jgi:hypothetical protein